MFSTTHLAAALLSFAVQVGALYLLAVLLASLTQRARRRVKIWLAFLVVTGADWVVWTARLVWPEANRAVGAAITALPGSGQLAVHGSLPSALAIAQPTAAQWLWGGYGAVVATLLLHAAGRRLHLCRLLRQGWPASAGWQRIFARLCREQRVACCRLLVVPSVVSPATAGWWRPVVVIPESLAGQLADSVLSWVLRHELAHVRRRDYLWDRLAATTCALVPFHPAAWLGLRRLRREREFACDEAVLEGREEEKSDYADCLMRLAKWRMLTAPPAPGQAVAFTRSGSLLASRVRTLLRGNEPRSWWARSAAAVCGLGLVLGGALLVANFQVSLALAGPVAGSQIAASAGYRPMRRVRRRRRAQPRGSQPATVQVSWRPPSGASVHVAAPPPMGFSQLSGSAKPPAAQAAADPVSSADVATASPLPTPGPVWSGMPSPANASPNSGARLRRIVVSSIAAIAGRISGIGGGSVASEDKQQSDQHDQ